MTSPTVWQLFDLTGKTALVTGACGHLGQALATALAEAGARVIVTSRDLAKAEQLASSLPGHASHLGLALDHCDESSIAQGVDQARQRAGAIDILVNNGHAALAADWTTVSGQQVQQQLAHAAGYFLLARAVRNLAVELGRPASIIMLGSMYGVVGSYPEVYTGICPASPAPYHLLKGGIIQLTRHLAVYWAPDNVRVNCLSPGPFPGPQAPAALVERLRAKSPMGRVGRPDELKGAIVFLASDASSYMTGQNLLIDGGWTAW